MKAAMVGVLLVGVLEIAPPVSANIVQTTDGLNVSTAGVNGAEGAVAFDPSGNALIVWSQVDASSDTRILLRIRAASGSFGSTVTLSPAGQDAGEPRIAVDATGAAVIAWRRFDGSDWRIQVVRRAASGSLSAIGTLSPAGESAESPRVAVDPAGNAYVVWLRWDGSYDRVELRRRSVGGTLGAVTTISPTGDAADPQIAVDAIGDAFVVWNRSDGSHTRIQMRRRTAAGTLLSVSTLSDAGQDALNARLAIDPARYVTVVWERFDGADRRIQMRRRAPDAVLGPVFTISEAGQEANNAVVAASAGGTIIAWERFDGAYSRIQVFRRDAAGAFSTVQTLSEAGAQAMGANVVIDAVGNSIITWRRWDGSNFRVQGARRSTGGTIGPVLTLSAAGQHGGVTGFAMDLKGNALAIWSRHDGTNDRVQASYLVQFEALSSPGVTAGSPELAVDKAGNAYVVWWRRPYMDGRRRSASGALSTLRHLNGGTGAAQHQQVVIDKDGNTYIVWVEDDEAGNHRVKLVRRSASGTFGAVQTLSAAGEEAFDSHVAVDGQGRVYVAWRRFDGANWRIQLRRRATSGSLTATQTLSAAGANALWPQLAVDATGNAVVTWARFDGLITQIQLRRRAADGTLGTVATVSAAGQNAMEPRIAMDTAGNAVIVWMRSDGAHLRVQAVRRPAGGGLSAVQTLSPAGQDASNADLAVDPSGNALVVWSRSDGANTRIELIRRSAAGTLSVVQAISAAGQNANVPDIAVDSQGRAVIVWTRYDGANRRLQGLRRSAAGTLAPVQTLSAPGENAGEDVYNGPRVATSPNGTYVIVTWYRSSASSAVILELRF